MTAPQPEDDDTARERAQERQTMDYPVELDRLPDALRSDDGPESDGDDARDAGNS